MLFVSLLLTLLILAVGVEPAVVNLINPLWQTVAWDDKIDDFASAMTASILALVGAPFYIHGSQIDCLISLVICCRPCSFFANSMNPQDATATTYVVDCVETDRIRTHDFTTTTIFDNRPCSPHGRGVHEVTFTQASTAMHFDFWIPDDNDANVRHL
jgi:hypothetical protein